MLLGEDGLDLVAAQPRSSAATRSRRRGRQRSTARLEQADIVPAEQPAQQRFGDSR